MNCSKCNNPVDEGLNFCGYCGEKIVKPTKNFCTDCGKEITNSNKVCEGCSSKNIEIIESSKNDEVGNNQSQIALTNTFCKNCGKIIINGDNICDECKDSDAKVAISNNTNLKIPNNKKSKKGIIFLVIFIGLIVSIGIFTFKTFGNKEKSEFLFYVIDNQLAIMDTKKMKPIILEDGLKLDGNDQNVANIITKLNMYNKDKTILFFPKIEYNKNGNIEAFTYNYLDLNKYKFSEINKRSVEIDSFYGDEFNNFLPRCSVDGKYLFYIKHNNLYVYKKDEGNLTKLTDGVDVALYNISSDGLSVNFLDYNRNLYAIDVINGEKYEIDKNTFDYMFDSKNNNLYYSKKTEQQDNDEYKSDDEHTLYKYDGKNEPIIIDENVYNVGPDILNKGRLSDDGEFYYTKKVEGTEISLYDFIDDDLLEADQQIGSSLSLTKPEYPSKSDYQTLVWRRNDSVDSSFKVRRSNLSRGHEVVLFVKGNGYVYINTKDELIEAFNVNGHEYNSDKDEIGSWVNGTDTEAYDIAVKEYHSELDKYNEEYSIRREKENRDTRRNELKSAVFVPDGTELYYYDGEKSIFITNEFNKGRDFSGKSGAFVYTTCELGDDYSNLLTFSDLVEPDFYYPTEDLISDLLSKNNVIIDGKSSKINDTSYISNGVFDYVGEKLYFQNIKDDYYSQNNSGNDYNFYQLDTRTGFVEKYLNGTSEHQNLSPANESEYMIRYEFDEYDNNFSIYIDNKTIKSKVFWYGDYKYAGDYNLPNSNIFLYMDSYNFDEYSEEGALMISVNGEEKEISKSVKIYNFTAIDEKIFYVSNENLYIYNIKNDKSILLDENVTSLGRTKDQMSWNYQQTGQYN